MNLLCNCFLLQYLGTLSSKTCKMNPRNLEISGLTTMSVEDKQFDKKLDKFMLFPFYYEAMQKSNSHIELKSEEDFFGDGNLQKTNPYTTISLSSSFLCNLKFAFIGRRPCGEPQLFGWPHRRTQ